MYSLDNHHYNTAQNRPRGRKIALPLQMREREVARIGFMTGIKTGIRVKTAVKPINIGVETPSLGTIS
jgi:hypothetical protein